MAILLDTSAIIALADVDDTHHHAVGSALSAIAEPLVVPLSVLPEVDYLVKRDIGVDAALTVMQSLVGGTMVIEHLIHADLERTIELMRLYADAYVGFVDSSIIALAERLNSTRIATLDRRHFTFVRPRHCAHFELLP